MISFPTEIIDRLRQEAHVFTKHAHAPYSGQHEAAVLLLEDGTLVPGVRVESASFSLTLSPLLNAVTTAWAWGGRPVVAAVLSRPVRPEEMLYLSSLPHAAFQPSDADDACLLAPLESLPAPGSLLDPFLSVAKPDDAAAGIALARQLARGAHVPFSHFPVGAVVEAEERLLPGVNVEHPDWSHILCAERTALGTAITYGCRKIQTLYLSCPQDPTGTPCGACRQLLAELAPQAVLWMDRGSLSPDRARPEELLPGSFQGERIRADA